MDIEIKTPEQIAVMREAGLVVARTLQVLAAAVRPGITTADLDALAEARDPRRGRHSVRSRATTAIPPRSARR